MRAAGSSGAFAAKIHFACANAPGQRLSRAPAATPAPRSAAQACNRRPKCRSEGPTRWRTRPQTRRCRCRACPRIHVRRAAAPPRRCGHRRKLTVQPSPGPDLSNPAARVVRRGPVPGGRGDERLFDWDAWRVDVGSDDLAYMMALHWYPELRSRMERRLLDCYHEELIIHGVAGYDRRALQEDYRLSVLWQIATPVWQHAAGIPPLILPSRTWAASTCWTDGHARVIVEYAPGASHGRRPRSTPHRKSRPSLTDLRECPQVARSASSRTSRVGPLTVPIRPVKSPSLTHRRVSRDKARNDT